MLSLTSALDGGGWLVTRLGRLSPGERPGTHYIGGCMGPNAGLDVYGKYRPHRDFFFLYSLVLCFYFILTCLFYLIVLRFVFYLQHATTMPQAGILTLNPSK